VNERRVSEWESGMSGMRESAILTAYPCLAARCRTVSPLALFAISFLVSEDRPAVRSFPS
jgi:hypothetical protein